MTTVLLFNSSTRRKNRKLKTRRQEKRCARESNFVNVRISSPGGLLANVISVYVDVVGKTKNGLRVNGSRREKKRRYLLGKPQGWRRTKEPKRSGVTQIKRA